jgi:hypothetical protein
MKKAFLTGIRLVHKVDSIIINRNGQSTEEKQEFVKPVSAWMERKHALISLLTALKLLTCINAIIVIRRLKRDTAVQHGTAQV